MSSSHTPSTVLCLDIRTDVDRTDPDQLRQKQAALSDTSSFRDCCCLQIYLFTGTFYETDLKNPLASYFGGGPCSVCDRQLSSPLIG